MRAAVVDTARRLDVNELTLFTANDGVLGYDRGSSNSWGLLFPRGSTNGVLFSSGLWVGAMVGNEVRVTIADYASEFAPGAIVGGVADDPAKPEYRVWKVARWSGDPRDTAHVERTAAELAADPTLDRLVHHGWSEYLANAAPHGAPVRTWLLPAPGGGTQPVRGPDVAGDVMLWSVFNDADPARHVNVAGSTPPLGVEVRQSVFAYAGTGPASRMAFVRWRIVNRNPVPDSFGSLTVAYWMDPDLGSFVDDVVGCDTTRSLGFVYNWSSFDNVYGLQPPALGADFLDESFDAVRGRTLGMDVFRGFIGGTDPASFDEAWEVITGGPFFGRPVDGGPFDFPGDPLTGAGELNRVGSDKRMVLARGHGTLAPGDSVDLTVALIVAQGHSRLGSVAQLRCLDDEAQSIHDLGFPTTPPALAAACPPGPFDCPRTPAYYLAQCEGAGDLRSGQLDTLATLVDLLATTLAWPAASARDSLCAVLGDSLDVRAQARREFVALLANLSCTEAPALGAVSSPIRIDPSMPVACTALPARNVAEIADSARVGRQFFGEYRNLVQAHRRALEGVNFGMGGFGGGAGYPVGHVASMESSIEPTANPDSFTSVEIRFDRTHPQLAYRYFRLENASDGGAPIGRRYDYAGRWPVPFTAWDLASGRQLDVGFAEKMLTADDGTYLPLAQQPASQDSTWDPSDDFIGDREYLIVFRSAYTLADKPALQVPLSNGTTPVMWLLSAKLRAADDIIDDGDAFEFQNEVPITPGADQRLLELEGRPLTDPSVVAAYESLRDCLAALNRGDWIAEPCQGSTGRRPALRSVDAKPEHVSLSWRMPPGERDELQRLPPGQSFWEPMQTLDVGASGQVSYEDADVHPGLRYGYRLGPAQAFGAGYIETFVDVPLPSALALSTFFPNPGQVARTVRFTLRSSERATLDILDVAGRLRARREVGSLGPGTHAVTLNERLAPGVYVMRLTQGRDHASAKGVIVR